MALPDCGFTAKATSLDTSEAFATETVMVIALAMSCAGTFTASAVQEPPPGQFVGVAELGVSTALPNFTCVLIPRPVPITFSVKLPLPAVTVVGVMAKMFGCTACGGGGEVVMELPPPHPEKQAAEITTVVRSTEFLRMEHRPRLQAAKFCLAGDEQGKPCQLEERKSKVCRDLLHTYSLLIDAFCLTMVADSPVASIMFAEPGAKNFGNLERPSTQVACRIMLPLEFGRDLGCPLTCRGSVDIRNHACAKTEKQIPRPRSHERRGAGLGMTDLGSRGQGRMSTKPDAL